MSKLQYKPNDHNVSGVTILQDVHERNSDLKYVAFKLIQLDEQATYAEELTDKEVCIVVLTGKASVKTGDQLFEELGTRDSVFEKKPTDSVYISKDSTFKIAAKSACKIALCYAPATEKRQAQVIRAADNSVEHRGKYQNKRMVHNILPDSSAVSSSLLVVEVYTDGGNFSSYPPHKHDQDNLPEESFLEETYYHEIDPEQGFVFQRVYTDDRSLDETMSVEHGDVVSVPKGYHPVGVPDGYTSYYLNVMAGPKKIWKFHNDPDHEWILKRK
ncbi:5-deoxy-glucuronate isomerase [Virgibacillus chiguensis]|uniref:5-deoxy-glucuronate isomerase n=1 Tax=Virgibacillus chiguensis TaxID=411959 RepID=A0A1M5TT76_9BACI|nr:5-deoxy-glucuronate isomerase [Virgibacillus chiguensis]SHH53776.1 5-deoxy-glucuronate isomerase [Virgibacillus chiguensis]